MLKGTFPVNIDGQEAQMIYNALIEKADRLQSEPVSCMYRILGRKVMKAKLDFHTSTYQLMADRYGLPK